MASIKVAHFMTWFMGVADILNGDWGRQLPEFLLGTRYELTRYRYVKNLLFSSLQQENKHTHLSKEA